MAKAADKLNRIAPWRFILFFALLAAGWAVGLASYGLVPGVLTGFNIAVHCVIGFFFNLGVLALAINVLGTR